MAKTTITSMGEIPDIMTKQQKEFAKQVIKPLVEKVLKDLEPKITQAIADKINTEVVIQNYPDHIYKTITIKLNPR